MAIAEHSVTPLLAAGELRFVDVDQLRAHPQNIRHDLGDLTDLVESIRQRGVRVPLQITTAGVVVCGHRRLAAAREAGCTSVPCVAGEYSAAQQFEDMLIENLQRNGLTPLEEARGYQQLLDLGEDVDAIASTVQTRAARIRERTALLQLPNRARAALQNGEITLGAATQLLKLREHPDLMERLVVDELDSDYAQARRGDESEREPVRSFYRVDHELQRLQEEKAIAEARARAEKQGLTVVDEPSYNRKKSDPQKIGAGFEYLHVDAKAHVGKPCHAVAITRGGKLVPVCTKPSKHAKEIAEARPAASRRSEPEPEPEDGVYDADDARFAFVQQLLQRAPHAFAGALSMLVVLGRVSYDDESVCKLLGLETDGKRYSTDSGKRIAAWLADGSTFDVDGPHVDPPKLAAAAAACTYVAIQEAAYHDPLMAFLIGTLQREGYEPNTGELELLARVPTNAAEWFA